MDALQQGILAYVILSYVISYPIIRWVIAPENDSGRPPDASDKTLLWLFSPFLFLLVAFAVLLVAAVLNWFVGLIAHRLFPRPEDRS